ncbi:MAG: hypothetical protein ABH822_01440 [Patescibacteria group bacterium]
MKNLCGKQCSAGYGAGDEAFARILFVFGWAGLLMAVGGIIINGGRFRLCFRIPEHLKKRK